MLKTPEQREQARLNMLARIEYDKVERRKTAARRAMRKRRKPAREVKRVTAWRKRKKAEVKAAHHAVLIAEKAARDARRVARQEKKALNLRKHATERQGFCDGFNTATPKTDAELKTQSWATRYREGYAHGTAEKRRCQELMQVLTKPATPAPAIIKLS